MRLKFTTIALLLAIASFFSCKKNSDSGYYVKFKLNGNWITWKTVIGELGPDLADASKTDLGVTANDDSHTNVLDISIQVNSTSFATGSYDSDNSNYWVVMSYVKNSGANFFDIDDAPGQPPSKYVVNVTSITPTELRGNFTGNYLYDFSSGEVVNITEGEFFVKRAR